MHRLSSFLVLFVFVAGALCSPYNRNPEENTGDDVFEGDMILGPVQRYAAENGLDVQAALKGRKAIKSGRWPRGIVYYTIDRELERNQTAMNAITAGMKDWTSKTCIKFLKRNRQRGYVKFTVVKGQGCRADVGYKGKQQKINLESGCWYKGIVSHEIGHTLGFYHEQSRPDRDNYVRIIKANIQDKLESNFVKYSRSFIDSLKEPYDYGSIMHYGLRAFSKNGKKTIVTKKKVPKGVRVGQRVGLSPGDVRLISKMYNCPRRAT